MRRSWRVGVGGEEQRMDWRDEIRVERGGRERGGRFAEEQGEGGMRDWRAETKGSGGGGMC